MEAIRNLDIVIWPRDTTLAILTVGNQTPLPIQPARSGAPAPAKNDNQRFDYFEYYSNVQQCLGGDTFSNEELAKELTDTQVTLIPKTAPTKQTFEFISKDQRIDPKMQSTAKSSRISPPGNTQSKLISTLRGPNFQETKIRSLSLRESLKRKPYVGIRSKLESYNKLESEKSSLPNGKQ
jgi:hypothetical protein